jgi:hypothetical protein
MPDTANQLSVTTRRYIRSNPKLVDGVFEQDPLNAYLRGTLKEDFPGGETINENFLYRSMIGGGYLKGKEFNIAQQQVEQQLRFNIKYLQVAVPFYMEDIRVLNKGAAAVVSLLKTRVDAAFMSLGAFISIAQYLNGTNAGYESNINGLAEALNNGTTVSWDNNLYTTYGGLTRSLYPKALSVTPVDLAGASIEYDRIDQSYMEAFHGAGQFEPNLIVTTPLGFSYLKTKFQTQQRFQEVETAGVGFRGLKMNGATVLASRYCPGSHLTNNVDGANAVELTYLRETSEGAVTAYPTGAIGTTEETLWILNARNPFLNYYVSTDEQFGGGFRDFIPAAGNTKLVGQVLLAHQLTAFPEYHRLIYGFTS